MFEDLNSVIDSHEACENAFFARAREKEWSFPQLVAFSPEYQHFTRSFPGILAGLISNVRDDSSRFFLTQILYSELGSGKVERTHFTLFTRLLLALGLSEDEIKSGPRCEETSALVEEMRRLYIGKDVLQAMGAQYALERQAFPMIQKLYVGFRHYEQLTSKDLEFFELHLVEEPEHLACMQNSIGNYVTSPEDTARVRAGSMKFLDLMATFWRRLFTEVSLLEEP